jgi:hypothetical protein
MGADSPLLARPRSGNTAQDPQPKRHRGSVRCPPLRHESALLDQDLEPLEQDLGPASHSSLCSSFAIEGTPRRPLTEAGGALLGQDMEPVFHDTPPRPLAGAGDALLGQDMEPLLHLSFAPTPATGETPHLPVTSADDALLGQGLDQRPRAPPDTTVPRQPPQGPAGHNGALPASTGPRQMPQIRQGPARHASALLEQDLGPFPHSSLFSSLAIDDTPRRPLTDARGALLGQDLEPAFHETPQRPLAGAGRTLLGQDVEPLFHLSFAPSFAIAETPQQPLASAGNALLGQDLEPALHTSSPPPFAIEVTPQLPLAAAGRARWLAPPSGHGRACESNT